MSLAFLVEHAGLDPAGARKMRREDITLTGLQEATLAERREAFFRDLTGADLASEAARAAHLAEKLAEQDGL